ncbi:magnesium/cobalt transporter CorA [Pseudochelatococcus contaminans]|uniref:Magnesium transport protein CorA n=1 Tax=Pseudochelatococcus contaminans TaxID=1538103 RepID=A0A7W6EF94_9HYPH|nr:magnesium/cobalt transporter CorA [Pseudochelatococcus contaminans]MBB3808683.1 magnesium transporter [Pseudochelatococcus contaminans]
MLIVYSVAPAGVQPRGGNNHADAEVSADTPLTGSRLVRHQLEPGEPIPADALWIDLVQPTRSEERLVEQTLNIEMPTQEDMDDIEASELLYHENGARYITVKLIVAVDDEPDMAGVTFVLKGNTLATVRYDEPRAFPMYVTRASRAGGAGTTADAIFHGLIETVIDRTAELLQATAEQINALSRSVFDPKSKAASIAHQQTLRSLGSAGTLIAMSRESLASLERALLFITASYRGTGAAGDLRKDIRSTLRDIQSLEEYANFQSGKVQFLLDATLGLVNLEQNNIIKLFSVMSVVFMPPTLIASIYGMNFQDMPELGWDFGYPVAIIVMIMAAVTPYFFFRWKGWL